MVTDVLLIGSGAREHSFAWKLRQSSLLGKLYVGPGNGGLNELADEVLNCKLPEPTSTSEELADFTKTIVSFCEEKRPDLVIVQTERAFCVTDSIRQLGIPVFGPSWDAAQIELSKIWEHRFNRRHRIPRPKGWPCETFDQALKVVSRLRKSPIIKADQPVRGKGVRKPKSVADAVSILKAMMVRKELGEAGSKVLIQEIVESGDSGDVVRELSLHAFVDGTNAVLWPTSCDHKWAGEQVTGGLGVFSPAVWLPESEKSRLLGPFVLRTVRGLADEGRPFCGTLYPGLMVTNTKATKLEDNARAGDPETQALLPRLKSDLLEITLACARMDGTLVDLPIKWTKRFSVCVVLCAQGYPDNPRTGDKIYGLKNLPEDILVFHGGTEKRNDGEFYTTGGRVLSLVALGDTFADARAKIYSILVHGDIYFEGMWYRDDIAADVA